MKKIYTIGYEGKSIGEFLGLLKKNNIQHLIDVRSYPKSKREKFNKKNLKKWLFQNSIIYKHIPGLGGLKKKKYMKIMTEEGWKKGYKELKDLAKEGKTVLMCLEKDPMICHRRHISKKLKMEGWDIVHIGRGGSWKVKSLDDF